MDGNAMTRRAEDLAAAHIERYQSLDPAADRRAWLMAEREEAERSMQMLAGLLLFMAGVVAVGVLLYFRAPLWNLLQAGVELR